MRICRKCDHYRDHFYTPKKGEDGYRKCIWCFKEIDGYEFETDPVTGLRYIVTKPSYYGRPKGPKQKNWNGNCPDYVPRWWVDLKFIGALVLWITVVVFLATQIP